MQAREPATFRERTTFIGRSRERDRLVEDLARGVELLTIVGPSGMGKTRLASTVGNDVAASFGEEGGVYFCSLANCSSVAEVEAKIARTLGILEWIPGQFELVLAQRPRTLLILDNGEWLASQLRALLAPWLERCPGLQLLVTSIVPLEIEGEVRLELGPLEPDDAVALYLERAHRAAAGRDLADDERPLVEELVSRLDRIPLAIELAAARVRVLPPRALLTQFERRLELLQAAGAEGRHRSWNDALSLTWELLSSRERRLLADASVFAGSFTFEAAVAVLGEEKEGEAQVLDLLDGLRGKALLQIHEGEHPRFSLLESIHTFAERKLEQDGRAEELKLRHTSYFVEMGEAHVVRLEGVSYLEALRSLRADRENLERVLHRNMERAPTLAARAGLVLSALADPSGYPPSDLHLLEMTVEAARRGGQPTLLARALGHRVATLSQGHRTREAADTVEDALSMARSSGDGRVAMSLLLNRSLILLRSGERALAFADLEEVESWARENGELPLEGLAALRRATFFVELEDAAAAEVALERAALIFRGNGLARLENALLQCEAGVKFLRGRHREARQAVLESQELAGAEGDLHLVNTEFLRLAMIEEAAGRLTEAEDLARTALTFFREAALLRPLGIALVTLGTLALKQGRWEEAERHLVEAVGIMEQAGDLLRRARTLPYLAVVEARAGRLAEAAQSMADAQTFLTENHGASTLMVTRVLEGCIELARARSLAATDPSRAEALASEARARLELAGLKKENRYVSEARDLLEADLANWEEGAGRLPSDRTETLRVGPEAEWFETSGGERVDLSRRATLRGMLRILVERRLRAPGTGIHALDLFSFGWPDEEVRPETALKRVYIGIWTLRGMGLAPMLLSRADGYLLDPLIPLLRGGERETVVAFSSPGPD